MTAPHGTPGPDDGYVKYRCLHTPGPAPAHPDLTALDALRTALFDAGLLGMRPDGVGFGNLSARVVGDRFVVTGTGTGGPRVLGPNGYCLVTEFDVDGNWVRSTGPGRPVPRPCPTAPSTGPILWRVAWRMCTAERFSTASWRRGLRTRPPTRHSERPAWPVLWPCWSPGVPAMPGLW